MKKHRLICIFSSVVFSLPQILSGIFVMAFCMLAALILPRQLFRRSSVKTVLQDNE